MSKIKEIITVSDLVKKYDDFTAVNGINFKVSEGEIFGLLGPNGAGKTTTVEILEGLRKPSSGSAEIDGINIEKNTKAVKRIIGVQLQECSFFDKLTLFEILKAYSSIVMTQDFQKIRQRNRKLADYFYTNGC